MSKKRNKVLNDDEVLNYFNYLERKKSNESDASSLESSSDFASESEYEKENDRPDKRRCPSPKRQSNSKTRKLQSIPNPNERNVHQKRPIFSKLPQLKRRKLEFNGASQLENDSSYSMVQDKVERNIHRGDEINETTSEVIQANISNNSVILGVVNQLDISPIETYVTENDLFEKNKLSKDGKYYSMLDDENLDDFLTNSTLFTSLVPVAVSENASSPEVTCTSQAQIDVTNQQFIIDSQIIGTPVSTNYAAPDQPPTSITVLPSPPASISTNESIQSSISKNIIPLSTSTPKNRNTKLSTVRKTRKKTSMRKKLAPVKKNTNKQKARAKKTNASKKGRKIKPTNASKNKDQPEMSWRVFRGRKKTNFKKFDYDGQSGPNVNGDPVHPHEFFSLFLCDVLLEKIAEETNRYAEQKILEGIANETLKDNSRLTEWKDTNIAELKTFFAIIMWFGLDQKPSIASYWSQNILYKNEITSSQKCMTRNRFELLLAHIHMCNNESADKDDKMYKIRYLIEDLNKKFINYYTPGRNVCIDESMMAWRGNLSFRQYIPSKRHKYGIKFFKLCLPHGYTHKFEIYSGKDGETLINQSLSERVVMNLCEAILNSNRTLYTDNFYTSVTLAKRLLLQNTHLVGTLRSNRKHNPPLLTKKKLEKGEMVTYLHDGIAVSKWMDKREVTFLTTKHRPNFVQVENRRKTDKTFKPEAIVAYNNAKTYIDVSDQKKAYSDPCRRGVKWYRKVMIELLCNTSVVNAYILFIAVTKKKLSMTEFREKLVEGLLLVSKEQRSPTPAPVISPIRVKHLFMERPERGRCVTCYQRVRDSTDRKTAQKLSFIHSYCMKCPEKFMCLKCFNSKHVSTLK